MTTADTAFQLGVVEAAARGAAAGGGSKRVVGDAVAAATRAVLAPPGMRLVAVPADVARAVEHLALALTVHKRLDTAQGHVHYLGKALAMARGMLDQDMAAELRWA